MSRESLNKTAIAALLGAVLVAPPGASRAETMRLAHDAVGCPTPEELSTIDDGVLDDPDISLRDPNKGLHILVKHWDCEILDSGQRVVVLQKGPQYSLVAVHPEADVPATPLFVRSLDIAGRGPKTVHPAKPPPPRPAPARPPAGGGTDLIN